MNVLPPWLESPFASVVKALDDGRLPHALLIHGPGSWGESVLAEALALRLIGRDAPGTAASSLAHPDLRWIVPEGAGEQIGIDAVRGIADFIVRTPQIASRKVAVVTRADAMNDHSANALLKTLEEPPPDSYLILVCDSLRDLLPTLRSRCRLIAVRPADPAMVCRWISEQLPSVDSDRLATLLFEYGGAPYHVLAALGRDEQPIWASLSSIATGQMNPLTLAESWAKDAPGELIDRWMRHLAQVIAQRLTDASPSGSDNLVGSFHKATEQQLLSFWDQLARDRILLRGTTNPNARLMFESRLLAWRDLASTV